ncbi:unnamed protein product [Closterium sp. NIES-53]
MTSPIPRRHSANPSPDRFVTGRRVARGREGFAASPLLSPPSPVQSQSPHRAATRDSEVRRRGAADRGLAEPAAVVRGREGYRGSAGGIGVGGALQLRSRAGSRMGAGGSSAGTDQPSSRGSGGGGGRGAARRVAVVAVVAALALTPLLAFTSVMPPWLHAHGGAQTEGEVRGKGKVTGEGEVRGKSVCAVSTYLSPFVPPSLHPPTAHMTCPSPLPLRSTLLYPPSNSSYLSPFNPHPPTLLSPSPHSMALAAGIAGDPCCPAPHGSSHGGEGPEQGRACEGEKSVCKQSRARGADPLLVCSACVTCKQSKRRHTLTIEFSHHPIHLSPLHPFSTLLQTPTPGLSTVTAAEAAAPAADFELPWPEDSMALCLVGQLRTFELTGPSIAANLVGVEGYGQADVFVVTPLDENSAKLLALRGMGWAEGAQGAGGAREENVMQQGEAGRGGGGGLGGPRLVSVRVFPDFNVNEALYPTHALKGLENGPQGLLQQFSMEAMCAADIAERERRYSRRYKWLMKARPDSFWAAPPAPLGALEYRSLTAPPGLDFGGVNDRLAVVPRAAGRAAFARLHMLGAVSEGVGEAGKRVNAETVYARMLQRLNVTVTRAHFPFCLVSHHQFFRMLALPNLRNRRGGDYCRPCHHEPPPNPFCEQTGPWAADWAAQFDQHVPERLAEGRQAVMAAVEGSREGCEAQVAQLSLEVRRRTNPSASSTAPPARPASLSLQDQQLASASTSPSQPSLWQRLLGRLRGRSLVRGSEQVGVMEEQGAAAAAAAAASEEDAAEAAWREAVRREGWRAPAPAVLCVRHGLGKATVFGASGTGRGGSWSAFLQHLFALTHRCPLSLPSHGHTCPSPLDMLPCMWTGALHCTAQHSALHCTALPSTLHCTPLHCTALHCTALHCTLHRTAMCCTELQLASLCRRLLSMHIIVIRLPHVFTPYPRPSPLPTLALSSPPASIAVSLPATPPSADLLWDAHLLSALPSMRLLMLPKPPAQPTATAAQTADAAAQQQSAVAGREVGAQYKAAFEAAVRRIKAQEEVVGRGGAAVDADHVLRAAGASKHVDLIRVGAGRLRDLQGLLARGMSTCQLLVDVEGAGEGVLAQLRGRYWEGGSGRREGGVEGGGADVGSAGVGRMGGRRLQQVGQGAQQGEGQEGEHGVDQGGPDASKELEELDAFLLPDDPLLAKWQGEVVLREVQRWLSGRSFHLDRCVSGNEERVGRCTFFSLTHCQAPFTAPQQTSGR